MENYDVVPQVLDTDNSELLKICGRSKPEKILKSKGNKMSVVFHSDSSKVHKGFSATWKAVKAASKPISGEIKSPNYPENYDNDKHVNFPLEVASGSIIELSFTDLDIESHPNCSFDYVQVFCFKATNICVRGEIVMWFLQVLDTDNSELLKICGRSKPFSGLLSKGNKMSVVFHSDGSEVHKGFSATWKAVEAASQPISGEITSPNYPENYPHNLNRKEYEIVVAAGKRVELTFEDLVIEANGSDCPYDNLKAYDTLAAGSPTLIAVSPCLLLPVKLFHCISVRASVAH